MSCEEDGSWIYGLLSNNLDNKIQTTINKVFSKNIVTALPVRMNEMMYDVDSIVNKVDEILLAIPATLSKNKYSKSHKAKRINGLSNDGSIEKSIHKLKTTRGFPKKQKK